MTLHYEATIDDPGAYTRPWTIAFDLSWNPNGEIMEYICQENNLWLKRLLKQVPEETSFRFRTSSETTPSRRPCSRHVAFGDSPDLWLPVSAYTSLTRRAPSCATW